MPDKNALIPTEPEDSQEQAERGVAIYHNLLAPLTSFVGRERDVEAIHNLLRNHRLLTLTGPGGSGKTRLALAVARYALPYFPDGVFFIPLGSLDDPDLLLPTIAVELEAPQQAGETRFERLRRFLRNRHLLLLLDNFEHLLAGATQLSGLLTAAPRLTILATSREPLHLYGEQEYPVPPLELPPEGSASEEVVMQAPAGRLFVERARAVRPHLRLDPESAAAVATICRLLDGLPLAIELAAARTRIFAPPALLARLEEAAGGQTLQFLSGGARDLPARQQALQATIDWSYHLLMADEQALFRRLAVFAGGCTLEAVGAVCFDGDAGEPEILNLLTSLVAKNLLQVEEGLSREPRFSLLHVMREYARERLERQGEAPEVGERHARFFFSLPLRELERAAWTTLLETEQDNIRRALTWAEEHDRLQMALAAAPHLAQFWSASGWTGEGGRWMEQLVAQSECAAPAVQAEIRIGAYLYALAQGDMPSALVYCERALEIYRGLEDPQQIASALLDTANCLFFMGEHEAARVHLEESLAIVREGDDPALLVGILTKLGTVAWHAGDSRRAAARYDEALAVQQPQTPVGALIGSGMITAELGDYDRGQQLLRRALDVCRAGNRRAMVANVTSNIGLVALRAGKLAEARTHLAEALRGWSEVGYSPDHWSLDGLARIAVAAGEDERAVRLWAAADYFDIGIGLDPPERDTLEQAQAAVRARLGPEVFDQAWSSGQRLSREDPDAVLALAAEELPTEPASPARSAGRRPFDLTPRQMEVLRLVAQGLSDAEVAEELVISPRTVNNHLTVIYGKLRVNSRTEAAAVAREHGLL